MNECTILKNLQLSKVTELQLQDQPYKRMISALKSELTFQLGRQHEDF